MKREDLQMGKPWNEAGVKTGVDQLRKASQQSDPPPELPELGELPGDSPLDTVVELRGPTAAPK